MKGNTTNKRKISCKKSPPSSSPLGSGSGVSALFCWPCGGEDNVYWGESTLPLISTWRAPPQCITYTLFIKEAIIANNQRWESNEYITGMSCKVQLLFFFLGSNSYICSTTWFIFQIIIFQFHSKCKARMLFISGLASKW